MKKYEGILLCSDLDGTLRNSEGKISQKNIEAIKNFCDNGGLFTLCTGRNPSHAKELCKNGLMINTILIALNGAMLYDLETSEVLYDNPINKAELFDVDNFIDENKQYIENVVFHSTDTRNKFCEIGDDKLYKIVFVAKTEEATCILRKRLEQICADKFFITNSWKTGMELLDKNSTKGECVKKIRNYIDKKITKIVCVGDYENDITMLEAADLAIAVGNALPEVKEKADIVMVTNDENAIEEVINHYLWY